MREITSTSPELQDLLNQYFYNKQKLEVYEAREDELKKQIKSLLGNLDFNSIPDGEAKAFEFISHLDDKIKITEVTTNRFDSSALEKKHPEIYKEFTKQTKTNRMTFAFNKAYSVTQRSELSKRRQDDVSNKNNADINASVDSKVEVTQSNENVTEI